MTDDQQLIAEAAEEKIREIRQHLRYGRRLYLDDTRWLVDELVQARAALSAAAVRYRAEGLKEALAIAERTALYAPAARDITYDLRALLDENNETQEN